MKRMSGHEQFQLSLFWLETEGPSRVLRGLFLFLLSPTSSAREGCTWCSGEPSHQVAGSKHPVSGRRFVSVYLFSATHMGEMWEPQSALFFSILVLLVPCTITRIEQPHSAL